MNNIFEKRVKPNTPPTQLPGMFKKTFSSHPVMPCELLSEYPVLFYPFHGAIVVGRVHARIPSLSDDSGGKDPLCIVWTASSIISIRLKSELTSRLSTSCRDQPTKQLSQESDKLDRG